MSSERIRRLAIAAISIPSLSIPRQGTSIPLLGPPSAREQWNLPPFVSMEDANRSTAGETKAPVGQTLAQMPHPVQRDSSSRGVLPSWIACVGQSCRHLSQVALRNLRTHRCASTSGFSSSSSLPRSFRPNTRHRSPLRRQQLHSLAGVVPPRQIGRTPK